MFTNKNTLFSTLHQNQEQPKEDLGVVISFPVKEVGERAAWSHLHLRVYDLKGPEMETRA